MSKRILIFSTAYLPFVGGAEIAVKEITDRLPDFEFVMLTARLDIKLPEYERRGNVEVHRVGRGNLGDKFRLIWSGHAEGRALGKFDAVWSLMASYAGFAALRYKKRNPFVPFLLTLQEGDSRAHIYKHVWWCWPYFKQIFERANRLQAISTYLADWAAVLGARGPTEVVPNGVAADKFILVNEERRRHYRQQLRQQLQLPPEARVIISASRLVEKNGLADLIVALTFLPAFAHIVIAGTGALHQSLTRLALSAGVASRVHWLGEIKSADLPALLWGSDVFCRPSLSEGLGNAFLEAMAAGVPVLGTAVGGITDFLRDGVTGWICQPHNPASVAEKIRFILDANNATAVVAALANARSIIAERFTWDIVAGQMREIFIKLCDS